MLRVKERVSNEIELTDLNPPPEKTSQELTPEFKIPILPDAVWENSIILYLEPTEVLLTLVLVSKYLKERGQSNHVWKNWVVVQPMPTPDFGSSFLYSLFTNRPQLRAPAYIRIGRAGLQYCSSLFEEKFKGEIQVLETKLAARADRKLAAIREALLSPWVKKLIKLEIMTTAAVKELSLAELNNLASYGRYSYYLQRRLDWLSEQPYNSDRRNIITKVIQNMLKDTTPPVVYSRPDGPVGIGIK